MTEQKSDVVTHEEIMQMNQQSWDALLLMTDVIPRINGSGKVTLTLVEYEKIMNNVKLLQKALLEITRLRTGLSCIENADEAIQLCYEEAVGVMKELAKATLEGTEKEHWAYKFSEEEYQDYKSSFREEIEDDRKIKG